MDRITKLILIALLVGCQPVAKEAQADNTIFQPTIFSTGSSLTINSGITTTFASGSITDFASGSTVDFTGATVTGLATGGTGDVTGPASSVDSEVALFSGTTGKTIKRATGSGIAKVSAGVLGTITDSSTNWDTAFSDRLKWDGGATGLTAATGRTSLGATTSGTAVFMIAQPANNAWIKLNNIGGAVTEDAATTRTSLGATTIGSNFFTLTNPGAIRFFKCDGVNNVIAEDAPTFRASIGAGTGNGNGTVTTFSAGDLSPIFTTTETNPTTTPALAFVLSTAGAKQFLGNNTGSTAAPTYVQPAFADLSGSYTLAQGPTTTAGVLLGRTSASSGTPQEMTLGGGLYASGQTVNDKEIGNASVVVAGSPQTIGNADTYLTSSVITVAAGDFTVGTTYHAVVHITKTGAGTNSGPLLLRIGTLGTTGDTSIATVLPAQTGTAVADTGTMEVFVTFTSIGSGTAASVRFSVNLVHNTAPTTGLWNTGVNSSIIGTIAQSGGFNSTTPTKVGLSYNGGASAVHAVTILKAELFRP